MDKNKSQELRQKAKTLLYIQNYSPEEIPEGFDIKRLIEELHTYQIELELQNEELLLTQEKLNLVNQRYVDLFENAPEPYILIDNNFTILEANNAFCLITEIQKDEITGKAFTKFISSEYQDIFYLKCNNLFKTDDSSDFDLVIRSITGQTRTTKIFAKKHLSENGSVFLRLALIDITETIEKARIIEEQKKEIEQKNFFLEIQNEELQSINEELKTANNEVLNINEQLNQSLKNESFLADLIRNTKVAVGGGYPDGTLGMVNYAFEKLTGYTYEELKSISWSEKLTPPEYEELEDFYLARLHESGEPVTYEKEYIRKDGTRVPIEVTAHIKYDDMGKPALYYGFITDITERKKFQDELIEKNTFIQTVLDNLPIGVALNRFNEGDAIYMNHKFEEIYGWPKEELINVAEFFEKVYPDENYRNQIIKRVIDDINSKDPSRMHWENIIATTKKGQKKIINAVNIPLLEQNVMVSTVMDVTEMKNAEAELEQHRNHLEELVRQRTAELEEKNNQLERMNQLFVGREYRIKELKEKIKELEEKYGN